MKVIEQIEYCMDDDCFVCNIICPTDPSIKSTFYFKDIKEYHENSREACEDFCWKLKNRFWFEVNQAARRKGWI